MRAENLVVKCGGGVAFTKQTQNVLLIAFFPRSKFLLISWLQSPSAVILEPKRIKSVTVSIFFPYLFAMK